MWVTGVQTCALPICPNGDVDSDEDEGIGNPFLTDSFGNLTTWRLSDLNAEFTKYLEVEASKPKEKKLTKEERLKVHSNRMERYMKSALQKYNGEEKLHEVCIHFSCNSFFFGFIFTNPCMF